MSRGECRVAGVAWRGRDVRDFGVRRLDAVFAGDGLRLSLPVSGGAGFRLQHAVFAAAAGTTQTVALVQGAITNPVGTKVVGATDRMLVLTNAPWLFAGDAVRVTTTATNAFGAVLVGEAQD